ncbi:hypothetical protein [Desulfurococcus amylolyticus]|uniref:hypothetical protein n=1 Tax=Desulfurococcus amylolyticus TaxID=94694 RepID=UPI000A5EC60C|nr:hypothetical protein [Desulfurococcus amylolyticus]
MANKLLVKTMRILTITLILALAVSIVVMAVSYRIEPYNVVEHVVKYTDINGDALFTMGVKPSIIYDNASVISSSRVFLSLAQYSLYRLNAKVVIYNNTEHGEATSIECNISASGVLRSSLWSKSLEPQLTLFCSPGSVYVNGSVNIEEILELASRIDREISSASFKLDYGVDINASYTVKYSDGYIAVYQYNPIILFSIDKPNNILSASSSNTSSSETRTVKNIVEKNMPPPFNFISIYSARVLTLYSTPILAILTGALLYLNNQHERVKHGIQHRLPRVALDKSVFKTILVEKEETIYMLAKKGYGIPVASISGDEIYLLTGTDVLYVYNRKPRHL